MALRSTPMLPDLPTLIAIVDEVQPRLKKNLPLQEAYSRLGLPIVSDLSQKEIADYLAAQIKAAFSMGRGRVLYHCRDLKRRLIHEHHANGAPLDPYFEVLARVEDSMRGDALELDVVGDWKQAIKAAVDAREWSGDIHRSHYNVVFKAEIAAAEAANRLKAVGLAAVPRKAPYEFSVSQHDAIARMIGKRVMRMGGIEAAARLFRRLEPKFCIEQGRYHDVDYFPSVAAPFVPRVPTNFLLQLAAKYPDGTKPYRRTDEDWKALVALSTDYATLHGVQPSNNMQWWPKDALSLVPFLRELALHDAFYTVIQLRPGDVRRIIQGLADGLLRGRVKPELYDELTNTLRVIRVIQDLVGNIRGPVRLTGIDIVKAVGGSIPEPTIRRILDTVLSHPEGGANANFLRPTESPDVTKPRQEQAGSDFGDRPLLKSGRQGYVLLSHSACAPAFVEAALSQLRRANVEETHVGTAVEGFLKLQLAAKGIPTKSGRYVVGRDRFECDIVIEAAESLIFIEVKKKSLTRAARTGLDIALLVDLTDSMLRATLQSGRHEYHLRTAKRLTLESDDGRKEIIDLQDRHIERMAISLMDYGSFQDRIAMSQILGGNLSCSFSTEHDRFSEKTKKVNERVEELRDLNGRLFKLAGSPTQWQPFFNCWFLSVPQFLVILDSCSGVEGFFTELRRTRNITLGSRDFYYEYNLAKSRAKVASN